VVQETHQRSLIRKEPRLAIKREALYETGRRGPSHPRNTKSWECAEKFLITERGGRRTTYHEEETILHSSIKKRPQIREEETFPKVSSETQVAR